MKHLMKSSASGFFKIIITGLVIAAMPQMLFADDIPEKNWALQLINSLSLETKDTISPASLERPLVFENVFILWPDRDMDGLDDAMETSLAEIVRPIFIFDSNETALEKDEPLTLFQVRPVDLSGPDSMSVRIRWVLLFRNTGGYGPCSALCGGSHKGDIKVITYEMVSKDKGITWETGEISLGEKENLIWKNGFDRISSKASHSLIFISSGRHNPYFSPALDGMKSPYSLFGCCDNADGKGAVTLPGIKNSGEPEAHPEPDFINSLAPFFPGYSAWGAGNFFSLWAGKISGKWLKNKIIPRDASLCSIESFNSPGNFIRHKRFMGEVMKIISARDRLDARFRIIPAASGKGMVKIESVNYPGYFLADKDGRLSLIKPGSEEGKSAAVFKMEKGLKGKNTVSFISTTVKKSYVRERDGHLFVESGRGRLFKKETSFRITSPQ